MACGKLLKTMQYVNGVDLIGIRVHDPVIVGTAKKFEKLPVVALGLRSV